MTNTVEPLIHVFISSFESKEAALAYSEPQWEVEPGEEVSDEVYEAWEDRNPSWSMAQDLRCEYLDSDFIETIWNTCGNGPGPNWLYLSTLIGSQNVDACKASATVDANTLILIFANALGGFACQFNSTPRATYCGAFAVLPHR